MIYCETGILPCFCYVLRHASVFCCARQEAIINIMQAGSPALMHVGNPEQRFVCIDIVRHSSATACAKRCDCVHRRISKRIRARCEGNRIHAGQSYRQHFSPPHLKRQCVQVYIDTGDIYSHIYSSSTTSRGRLCSVVHGAPWLLRCLPRVDHKQDEVLSSFLKD